MPTIMSRYYCPAFTILTVVNCFDGYLVEHSLVSSDSGKQIYVLVFIYGKQELLFYFKKNSK